MMPKQYVAVQFRLKLGKLSIAAQSCPTTRAVTPRLSLFSDDGILNKFVPYHLLLHQINVFQVHFQISRSFDSFDTKGSQLEHKTCNILAAERLRLMIFDNRLIIDSFQKAICILKW